MADVQMPQLGETVTEGPLTKWFKTVGDEVAQDEVLFDVQLRLLGVERRHRGLARRAKVYQDLEKELEAGLYWTK